VASFFFQFCKIGESDPKEKIVVNLTTLLC